MLYNTTTTDCTYEVELHATKSHIQPLKILV